MRGLASSPIVSFPCSNLRYFITAPNIFHVGVEESVSVTIYNAKRPVGVTLVAQDFPNMQRNLTTVSGVFTSGEYHEKDEVNMHAN